MKISILTIGKLKEKHWQVAAAEYRRRLGRYAQVQEIILRDAAPAHKPPGQIINEESEKLLAKLPPQSCTTVLDGQGELISSKQLAEFIERKCVAGYSHFAFCLGGPHGLSDKLLQGSDFVLSLSRMTFPHELARVLLLEQLYRAFTILRGQDYHK